MTSKAYQLPETALTWDSAGTTELFTCTSVAANAGRQGALHDFGTSAHARDYAFRGYVKFATAPVVGQAITVFWKSSDGTHPDNDDGTGDIAVSAQDKLLNLEFLGSIIVDEVSTTAEMVVSGLLEVVHRHGSPVFWNQTADALSATAADCGFILTPMPMQGQDT